MPYGGGGSGAMQRGQDEGRSGLGDGERFRTLADAVPAFVWFATPDGRVHFLNSRWYEYTGQTPEEALPDGWAGVLHPDDAQTTAKAWAEARARGVSYEIELRYRRHDGVYRWYMSRAEPLRDAEGRIVEWFGASTDIHDRKTAEAELQRLNEELRTDQRAALTRAAEADALYRAYFENAGDSLFVVRVTEDGDFIAEQTNPAHQKSTGLTNIAGRRLVELLAPETAGKVLARYREVVASGQPLTWREDYLIDGRTVFWDTTIVPIRGEDGRISRIFGSGRDVTAIVMAEEALKQSQKMQALGQLAGGIAHDFNNLLAAVVGSLDLLQRRTLMDERSTRFLEAARAAADRGAKLTSQLLAFARTQRLELKPVELNGLVEKAKDLLVRSLGPDVRLTLDLAEEPVAICTDPTQLELAVMNLVLNARDAIASGGEIRVSTRTLTITDDPSLPPGEYAELAVADDGAGMTPEVAARALEPFFTTKGVGRGTGLGLSQVYGLARQAGGLVRIETMPGQGTTVRVLAPRLDDEPMASSLQDAAGDEAATVALKVLVVDDDPDVRRFMVDALSSLGHDVLEAGDGAQALRRLSEGPDLAVIDFAMPGMNGAALAQAIRERRPALPIVFVSGYADSAALDAFDDCAVLRKPFRVDELGRVVVAAAMQADAPD